ncbi:hypothetical protein [Krasilnikovia sp. MM14-A1004]|uniref:hypothetical protein n=1 Tax=Krasilnikovia sp. MM14-A1004 TaxID=3373541 RepID=UPI00399CB8DA
MDLLERHGPAVALVTAEEAVTAPWRSAGRCADVARVVDRPGAPELTALGFVRKRVAIARALAMQSKAHRSC